MLIVEWKPLVIWPGKLRPSIDRRPARFKAGYLSTMQLLEDELWKVDARDIVIELAIVSHDIRSDGRLRADTEPKHPGVLISFQSCHGPLQYPCDTFTHWHDNLRAIALSLECLRACDRYGVTSTGEQYKGWAALPPPSNDEFASVDKAIAFLSVQAVRPPGKIIESPDSLKRAYRDAAKSLHPDSGGNERDFKKLQTAMEMIKKQMGWQ